MMMLIFFLFLQILCFLMFMLAYLNKMLLGFVLCSEIFLEHISTSICFLSLKIIHQNLSCSSIVFEAVKMQLVTSEIEESKGLLHVS